MKIYIVNFAAILSEENELKDKRFLKEFIQERIKDNASIVLANYMAKSLDGLQNIFEKAFKGENWLSKISFKSFTGIEEVINTYSSLSDLIFCDNNELNILAAHDFGFTTFRLEDSVHDLSDEDGFDSFNEFKINPVVNERTGGTYILNEEDQQSSFSAIYSALNSHFDENEFFATELNKPHLQRYGASKTIVINKHEAKKISDLPPTGFTEFEDPLNQTTYQVCYSSGKPIQDEPEEIQGQIIKASSFFYN